MIVFDDMTRPTPVKDIAPYILASLHRAGMKKDQIRFLWALGAHGAYDMINARKKLGEEIVENYAVYNHDPFQNTVRVGRTPTGVELWFNREFMACDLKIGIGCITPHVHVGSGEVPRSFFPGWRESKRSISFTISSTGTKGAPAWETLKITSCGPSAMLPGMRWD